MLFPDPVLPTTATFDPLRISKDAFSIIKGFIGLYLRLMFFALIVPVLGQCPFQGSVGLTHSSSWNSGGIFVKDKILSRLVSPLTTSVKVLIVKEIEFDNEITVVRQVPRTTGFLEMSQL